MKSLQVLSTLTLLLTLTNASTPPTQQPLNPSKAIFTAIRAALIKASIIPEVIDDFTPKCFVSPNNGKRNVTLGNSLKPSKTQEKPGLNVVCETIGGRTGLTIALTDPDAPSRVDPKWAEMCHWIARLPVGLMGGDEKRDGDGFEVVFEEGGGYDELVEYKPPGPPPKTGWHRYVFLLLESDNSNLTKPEERQHWGTGKERHGVRDWARDEGLKVIGANFFYERNKEQ